MRKMLLSLVAVGGLLGLAGTAAEAAPVVSVLQPQSAHAAIQHVDYYWNHRHWHHRHWEHNRWRYYD